jgi:NAD(P)-dependent dehydrogenase (short-subunit alcohol dehydrogenase family)
MRKTALITGGTRGIGLGIARKLAKEGINLAINGVRPESEVTEVLEELREMGVRVDYFPGNIAEKTDRESILNGVNTQFGTLNFLINNAGVAPRVRADVLEVAEEDFDHLMEINLKGTFFLTQAMANWMVDQKKAVSPILPRPNKSPITAIIPIDQVTKVRPRRDLKSGHLIFLPLTFFSCIILKFITKVKFLIITLAPRMIVN